MADVRVPMIDLMAEYRSLQPAIDAAIGRVITSGSFVLGPEVEAFETAFAAYCGVPYAVGVGSGTAALHLALLACGLGAGDEVITVPNTDLSTTMVIGRCGARLVWVDVDPRTYTVDPDRVEAAITPRTRALLPVHLHGHPADMDPLRDIARRHGLWLIEDAALAAGAEYHGRKAGSLSDAGCFSLAPGKILGAFGDAGIIVTPHREFAQRVRVLRNYGFSLDNEASLLSPLRLAEWRVVEEGYNERLDALQAAVLAVKLRTLEERIARRQDLATLYGSLLDGLNVVLPHVAPHVRHVYRGYHIQVADRDTVRRRLAERGIASRTYYSPPLHLQPAYAHLDCGPGSFPVVERLAGVLLALPLFPEMADEQVALVADALRACLA